jgi:hypothetical protein
MADRDAAVDEVRSWLMAVQERPAPPLDLDVLLRAGRQHRRKRRTIEAIGLAAAAVVVAGGTYAIFGTSSTSPPSSTDPGATESVTPTTSPSATPTDTTPAPTGPMAVPGYTYQAPSAAALGGFDYQRSVRELAGLYPMPGVGSSINEVLKNGEPQQILVLQYSFDPPDQMMFVVGPDGDKLMGLAVGMGFAEEPPGTSLDLVHVQGTPAYRFSAGDTFYAWGDRGAITMVSGKDAATTDAFVNAYLKAAQLP